VCHQVSNCTVRGFVVASGMHCHVCCDVLWVQCVVRLYVRGAEAMGQIGKCLLWKGNFLLESAFLWLQGWFVGVLSVDGRQTH